MKTITTKTGPVTPATMKAIYLFIFGSFASDTKEIAEEFGFTTADAYRVLQAIPGLCSELMEGGTSTTRKRAPGVAYTWQCNTSHDNENAEAAAARIDALLIKAGYVEAAEAVAAAPTTPAPVPAPTLAPFLAILGTHPIYGAQWLYLSRDGCYQVIAMSEAVADTFAQVNGCTFRRCTVA